MQGRNSPKSLDNNCIKFNIHIKCNTVVLRPGTSLKLIPVKDLIWEFSKISRLSILEHLLGAS